MPVVTTSLRSGSMASRVSEIRVRSRMATATSAPTIFWASRSSELMCSRSATTSRPAASSLSPAASSSAANRSASPIFSTSPW